MISKFHLPSWILLLILLSFIVGTLQQEVTDFSHISNFKNKRVDYPVRFTYVNRITKWWPPSQTLAQMAVPGYAASHSYNYVALTFWTCQKGPMDTSKLWDDPIKYFGQQLGKTKLQVQKFLKKKYNQANVSIILSAFGASQYPTTLGLDPVVCAKKLGDYVKQNNFDGVDIDYEDNEAMNKGKGQQWLITFMTQLRKIIPYHLVTHAPQGPYFMSNYVGGGYRKVHKQVGHLIDFYNVQFYNQLNATYETYDLLFKNSGVFSPQTSISQIRTFGGVPYNMLVLGKPGSKQDVYNTGYVRPYDLYQFLLRGSRELGWNTGFMFWQYSSDLQGTIVNELTHLMRSLSLK